MSEDTRLIAITRQEAELLLDSFKVTNVLSRSLALKAASVVIEFAAEEQQREARMLLSAAAPAE